MDIKNVTSESKEELSVEEVNVYGWYEKCDLQKVHCMTDCFGNGSFFSTNS